MMRKAFVRVLMPVWSKCETEAGHGGMFRGFLGFFGECGGVRNLLWDMETCFFKCFFGLHVSDKDVYGDSLWCLSRLKKATATTSLIPQICMARLATTPLQPFRSISTDLLKLGRLLKTLEIITGHYENEREETS